MSKRDIRRFVNSQSPEGLARVLESDPVYCQNLRAAMRASARALPLSKIQKVLAERAFYRWLVGKKMPSPSRLARHLCAVL